jgi:hypothetical protein
MLKKKLVFLLPVLMLLSNSSAFAETVRGINVSLLPPGKSSLSVNTASPAPSDIDELQKYNVKRLAVLRANGFNLVRLRFHMALIRPGASVEQRELAMKGIADFTKQASDKGIRTLVALFPENGHDQHDLICDRQDEFLQTIESLARVLRKRRPRPIRKDLEGGIATRWRNGLQIR